MPTTTKPRTRLAHILEQPWALYPQTLSRIVEWARGAAEETDPTALVALNGSHDGGASGSVAVIPVYGVIEQHSDIWMELFGGTSVDGLREDLRAALGNPDVKAIVLDIDSPGGSVAGITELAAEIRDARGGTKPIVASANAFCASAAYWLASQCDEVTATPSAQVGSIGVYAVHEDISRMLDEMGVTVTLVSAGPHKTEGNMFEPLSDEARADMQSRVDDTYRTFLADVAAGRRVSTAQVESDFGGGRVMTAKKAASAGMVDRVETLGATIVRLGSAGGRRRMSMAAATVLAPELAAEDDETQGDVPPFTDRLAALAVEATEVATAAAHRARSRAAAGRPAFSTTTERALRESRDALNALLDPGEPDSDEAQPTQPGEPVVAAAIQPPPAANPARFRSRDDWLRFLETRQ